MPSSKDDIKEVRSDLKEDLAEVKSDIKDLRQELSAKLDKVLDKYELLDHRMDGIAQAAAVHAEKDEQQYASLRSQISMVYKVVLTIITILGGGYGVLQTDMAQGLMHPKHTQAQEAKDGNP